MTKLRVNAFSISLDGYGAGPDQSLANPLGRGGEGLHTWFIGTKTFQRQHGEFNDPRATDESGRDDIDEQFAARAMDNVGAWIMGRNMFGHQRGEWPDDGWKGWWGPNPPYHCPVFVLTHHARPSIEMEGGTVFHFVTDGIHAALERARAAAKGKEIRVGGGTATVRDYLRARLIDSIHVAISPVLLGGGESLFADLDLTALGYGVTEHVASQRATHVVISKTGS
jgi:dihydrofolate reductase